MDMYDLTVPQLAKTLRNLDRWIERASAHARTHELASDVVMTARLAPAKPLACAARPGRAFVAWARHTRRCRKRAGADEGARGQ